MNKISYTFLFIIILIIFYNIIQFKYYSSRYYGFDPFTQMDCQKYDSLEIKSDDLVVLCLGGSTTNDQRLNIEDRYPSILEKKLQEIYKNKRVIVLNGGMDWYTTKHSLINYTTYYKKFKPQIVVVMHAINDICRSFSPVEFSLNTYQNDYSHYYGPVINAANPPVFEKHLLLNFLGDYKYQNLRWNLKPHDIDFNEYKSYQDYSFYYNTLIKTILDNNSKCIIVEQPSLLDYNMAERNQSLLWFGRSLCNNGHVFPNYKSLYKAMNKYNSSADSLAKYYNLAFIKTDSIIPKNNAYFKDDVHHTNLTTAIIAELVKNNIETQLMFDL